MHPHLFHRFLFVIAMLSSSAFGQDVPAPVDADGSSSPALLLSDTLPPTLGQENQPRTLWQAVRLNIPTYIADIRDLIRYGGDSEKLGNLLAELQAELNEYDRLAQANATEEYGEIWEVKTRTELLMDYLANDYDIGTNRQVLNSLRLLEESVNRLEELAFIADQREGRLVPEGAGLFPEDWQDLRYGDPAARLSTTVMDAAEITNAIDRRRELLQRSSRTELRPQDEFTAREIGEMARALVLRQGEFPPLMRPGFRNSALRMEVISENLIDFLRNEDRANYRRQLMLLDDALDQANNYIRLRSELSQRRKQ